MSLELFARGGMVISDMAKAGFTFVCGADDFLVSRAASQRWAEMTREIEDDFGKEVISGDCQVVDDVASAIGQFSESVRTMPMFGDRKVVWFKNISFLGDNVLGNAETTKALLEGLQEVLKSLSENCEVLLSAFPVDRRRGFAKWAENNGTPIVMGSDKKGGLSLTDLIVEEAKAQGKKIAGNAAEALAAKASGNTRLAMEEVNKLVTYLGNEGDTITRELVLDLVPDASDSDFFEISEAFESGNLEWARDAVRRHFFNNKDARGVLFNLQGRNRLMIQLRALLDVKLISSRVSKDELAKAQATYGHYFEGIEEKSNANVFSQNPFYLSRLAGGAMRVNLKRLISHQHAFAQAFDAMISHPHDAEKIMSDLVTRCLAG